MHIDKLRRIPGEVSKILPSEKDLENAQISFDDFLHRVYPKVSNDIFPVVQQIIQGFGLYCNHNLDGGFAKVQRG